jgi:hypothetical protein
MLKPAALPCISGLWNKKKAANTWAAFCSLDEIRVVF